MNKRLGQESELNGLSAMPSENMSYVFNVFEKVVALTDSGSDELTETKVVKLVAAKQAENAECDRDRVGIVLRILADSLLDDGENRQLRGDVVRTADDLSKQSAAIELHRIVQEDQEFLFGLVAGEESPILVS